jgi:hypothetical protein
LDNNEALTLITGRLQPGERLIWYGVPSPWRAAAPYLFPLAFMTFWTGGVLYAASNAYAKIPNPSLRDLLGPLAVPVLFGVIGAAAWLWNAKKIADCWRTAYGLTDRRVIIAVGRDGPCQSFGPAALADIERTGNEASGNLRFDRDRLRRGYGFSPGLFGIPGPARVEALIYETLLRKDEKGASI